MQYVRLTISFLFALCAFVLPQTASATAYYVDFQCGTGGVHPACSTVGTATTTPFNSLDQFTEVARSAGDIVFVRRNTASTTAVSDLNFTSDGTIARPIIISADNDNLWNDASTTAQTYTVAVATSTFTASATITGVTAGDWFYVSGDCTQTYNSSVLNQCEYFYEVESVSGTQLRLYMPYKGDQTGAGLSLVNLGKNPQWNVASGDFQWNFDTDDFWLVKGIDIRGTDVNGNVEIDSSREHIFLDTQFTGNGASDTGLSCTDDTCLFRVIKSRFLNHVANVHLSLLADTYGSAYIRDSILDGSSVASSVGLNGGAITSNFNIIVKESFFQRHAQNDISSFPSGGTLLLSNVVLRSTEFQVITTYNSSIYQEYSDGILGFRATGVASDQISTTLTPYTNIATTAAAVIRSGGGATSIEVLPTTVASSTWDFNKIKLFEYPIYTDDTSKQYDVYFMATSTTAWTANPTASQLWIECEYWAHNTGATSTRKITKSTGTVDFDGSTAWQALSVTCDPSQTGILELRGWYAKPKETPSNFFFVDGTPVIN